MVDGDEISRRRQEESLIKRFYPQSDIDLQLLLTDSLWGSGELVNLDLVLRKYKAKVVEAEGKKKIVLTEQENLWKLLEFFTRDLRLGNLDKHELFLVRYDLELATDLLSLGCYRSFITCLSRVAGVLETSQSKGGFLRRIIQSIFRHETREVTETQEGVRRGFLGVPGLKIKKKRKGW